MLELIKPRPGVIASEFVVAGVRNFLVSLLDRQEIALQNRLASSVSTALSISSNDLRFLVVGRAASAGAFASLGPFSSLNSAPV